MQARTAPPGVEGRGLPSSTPSDRLGAARLAVLGVNAWVVCLVVPAIHTGIESIGTLAALGLPLAALAAGTFGARSAQPWAAWALGAGYPGALGVALAAAPELRRLEAWAPVTLALAGVSLLAFLGAAAVATSRPHVTRRTSERPLPDAVVPEIERGRLWRQRIVFGAFGLGALLITSVAPWLGGPRSVELSWGDAAREGALLTAVATGAVASSLFALFLGPALRLTRAVATPRQRRARIALLLLLVALGAATIVLLRRMES